MLVTKERIQNHTRGIPISDDFVKVENTSEEIRELVLEYIKSSHESVYTYSEKQKNANRLRVEQAKSLVDSEEFIVLKNKKAEVVHHQFRIASRVMAFRGSLGKKYLEDCWEYNANNENLSKFDLQI